MMMMSTIAQKPNTISTSPSRCHKPAWFGWRWASFSKIEVEKVWTSAMAKIAAEIQSSVSVSIEIDP